MLVLHRQDELIGTSVLARPGEPVPHARQLVALAAPRQAFHQPVQRPHVVRVLCAPLDRTAQPKVVAIDLLGFLATCP